MKPEQSTEPRPRVVVPSLSTLDGTHGEKERGGHALSVD